MGRMHGKDREDQLNRRESISAKGTVKSRKEHHYWGYKAQQYDTATAYVVGEETQRETRAWLLGQLQATDHVLELGCGTGQFSEGVAQKVGHLTATEGAVEMLDLAKERLAPFANVIVQMEDCYRTTFADGIFDGVFLGNVLHILGQPMEALTESRRVLKPGGRILLADATSFGMPFWSKLAMGMRYLRKFGKPPKENRIVSPDDVAQLLEAANFVVEESRLVQKETDVVCVKGRKIA
jgi:ubiquinone/menaquinone biosynthesis C-methylase UbiE